MNFSMFSYMISKKYSWIIVPENFKSHDFNDSKSIWAIVGKWKHFFYFVHFPHISAMTKYFTSTQLLIFSTSGKIFQPQLFWHQNISTCPSFFCYDEIIFQITNFWIKRLLIQPKLFQPSTWIGLIWSKKLIDHQYCEIELREPART